MSDGLTPLVWSNIAQYGAITSSFEVACTTLTGWGINLSLKRIERLTYKFGQIGINLRQSKILNRQLGNLDLIFVIALFLSDLTKSHCSHCRLVLE